MEQENKIILTRHLSTANNRNKIIMGRSLDVDIVFDNQVEDFSNKIRKLATTYSIKGTNSFVVTSPLRRCVSTATIICNTLKSDSANLKVVEELTETDMGTFEGLTGTQLRESFPKLLDQWMQNPVNFKFPNGESYNQVSGRVDQFMSSLSRQNLPRYLFVCTHVDIIKMFLLKIEGKSFNERRKLEIPNGNISVVTILDKQTFKVIDTNWEG